MTTYQAMTVNQGATILAPFKSARKALLQRKCACGGTPGPTGECEGCRKKRLSLQRRSLGQAKPATLPPIVDKALRSPGRPLDAAPRAVMESRFGHDFSHVRVHDDGNAAESARTVNASAYTVAKDIVFAAGRYAPQTHEGRLLLAHELTHVLQQNAASAGGHIEVDSPQSAFERQADEKARAVIAGEAPAKGTVSGAPISVQRSCGTAAIGKPTGCIGIEGDILGEPFLFLVGCDDFRGPPYIDDEEARLKSFAATLSAGDFINIHGFASIEGDSAFNTSLSCARAIAAQRVIQSVNSAPMTIRLFQHGATAGDRDERRCVIIERTPAQPAEPTDSPKAPPQPAPNSTDAASPTDSRHLTEAERNIASFVFGQSLNLDPIMIKESSVMSAGGYVRTLPDTIYVSPGMLNTISTDLLMHELTHCAQYQHGVSRVVTAAYAISAHYDYGYENGLRDAIATKKCFTSFNTEQQADIVRDYYLRVTLNQFTYPWSVFIAQVRANGTCIWPSTPAPVQDNPSDSNKAEG